MTEIWKSRTFFGPMALVFGLVLNFGLVNSDSINATSIQNCEDLHNGCSVPKILSTLSGTLKKYHDVFDPACLKHDICYGCGQYKDWNKDACDKTLFQNMMSICHGRHRTKRASLWSKIMIASTLGYDMVKWLTIADGTLEHCQHGAGMFYKAVIGFGDGNYGDKGSQSACNKTCVLLGKPNNGQL